MNGNLAAKCGYPVLYLTGRSACASVNGAGSALFTGGETLSCSGAAVRRCPRPARVCGAPRSWLVMQVLVAVTIAGRD